MSSTFQQCFIHLKGFFNSEQQKVQQTGKVEWLEECNEEPGHSGWSHRKLNSIMSDGNVTESVTTEPSIKSIQIQQSVRKSSNGEQRQTKRLKRPNYAQIHAKPLPILTYPLPTFIPHNPLSLVKVFYAVISYYLFPPKTTVVVSNGYFSHQTRSVHVTDPSQIRTLWEMGFFGKGTLSRSEPNWLDQEKRRLGLKVDETSEEITNRRRRERQKMKMDRARLEREVLDKQRERELNPTLAQQDIIQVLDAAETVLEMNGQPQEPSNEAEDDGDLHETDAEITVVNQEHLQLSLEEAFFLVYTLGALRIHPSPGESNLLLNTKEYTPSLLTLFRCHSYFPPLQPSEISPDDPFLLHYVVYHHFRSLGWVVRDGIKFSVDYLLYERGPVFRHAAFAIVIVPSYTNPYWDNPDRSKTRTERRKAGKDMTWLHCVNRVQSQVFKTLVLVYVDIPSPEMPYERENVGKFFQRYKVREFCLTRWSPNRHRD